MVSTSRLISITVLALALLPCQAAVTSVTGTLADDTPITVTGTGFGATGPTVVVFDDFDHDTNSDGYVTTADTPHNGSWSHTEPTDGGCTLGGADNYRLVVLGPVRSATYRLGDKGYGAYSDSCSNPDCLWNSWTGVWATFTENQDVFWQVWRQIPAGEILPSEGTAEAPSNRNWKWTWVYNVDTQHNDHYYVHNWDPEVAYPTQTAANHGGNKCPLLFSSTYNSMTYWDPDWTDPSEAPWVRAWGRLHRDYGELTGTKDLWESPYDGGNGPASGGDNDSMLRVSFPLDTDTNGYICSGTDAEYCPTDSTGWNIAGFNAYMRSCSPNTTHPTIDDAYVAIGPGASARVEISNYETYDDLANSATTSLALCVPTSWSATSVECTLHTGQFASDATAYLFVIDADGTVSDQDGGTAGAQGYAVTLGTGTAATGIEISGTIEIDGITIE